MFDLDMGSAYINWLDKSGTLIRNKFVYSLIIKEKGELGKVLYTDGRNYKYIPIENGIYAGKLWELETNEKLPYKTIEEEFGDFLMVYPKEGSPYIITDWYTPIKSNKVVILENYVSEEIVCFGTYRGKGVHSNSETKDEVGAYLCNVNGTDDIVKIGNTEIEIYNANCYPFNYLLKKPYVIKTELSGEKKGEYGYSILDTDLEDNNSLSSINSAAAGKIEEQGVWILGNEDNFDGYEYDSNSATYFYKGEEIYSDSIELSDARYFTYLKTYTDEKSERKFIAKDTENQWYVNSLLKPISIFYEGKRIYKFEDVVPINEITKDYEGFDGVLKGYIWVKLNNEWRKGLRGGPSKTEENERVYEILERISKSRMNGDNLFDKLKKVERVVKI